MKTTLGPNLKQMTRNLNQGNACNFTASARLYPAPGVGGRSLEEIVYAVLGDKVLISGSRISTGSEMIAKVKSSFEFRGDDDSHPNLDYISSDEFESDLEQLLADLKEMVQAADLIMEFWLKQGHPFKPVHWDFAFVLTRGVDASLLIASSSDSKQGPLRQRYAPA